MIKVKADLVSGEGTLPGLPLSHCVITGQRERASSLVSHKDTMPVVPRAQLYGLI